MGRMENFSEHDLDLSMMKESVRQRMIVESKMSNGEFDNYTWEDCPTLARFVGITNITARWWERRIANLLGWETQPTQNNDGKDYGDLCAPPHVIGEDNIELKVNEKLGRPHIQAQQFRFYENIPWYMLWKLDPVEDIGSCYMLSKQDLYREIFEHKSILPHSSQGSGRTVRMNANDRRKLINETFEKKNDILWGFGINPQTQVELHERWVDSYQIDIKTLENWEKFKQTRA